MTRKIALNLVVAAFAIAAAAGIADFFFAYTENLNFVPAMTDRAAGPAERAADEPAARSLAGRPIYGGLGPGTVICLGDSFAFSTGVPDTETFAFRLQALLNEGSYFRGPYRVVNLGAPGAGLKTQLEVYRRVGARLPHERVVLIYGWNDINDTYREEFRPWPSLPAARFSPFLKPFAAGRILLRALHARLEPPEAPGTAAAALYRRDFAELMDLVRKNGARAVMLMVDGGPGEVAVVAPLCGEFGVPFRRQNFSAPPDRYRLPDGHFSAAGNQRLAEEAISMLADMKRGR